MESTDPISMTYDQASDLVNRIEQLPPLTGTGAPTTSTPAWYIGQRYIDTQSNNEYYCVEIPSSGLVGYIWQPVDTSTSYTGGDGINIDAQNVISATNTGRAKVLTTDDYNANSSDWTDTDPANFNCIALWKLDAGVYNLETGLSGTKPTAYLATRFTLLNNGPIWIGEGRNGNAATRFYLYQDGSWKTAQAWYENGEMLSIPTEIHVNVENRLTSTSATSALSAAQGKVLNDKIGGDLSNLTTTDKTSLVAAINELNANLSTANTDLQTLLNGTGA